MKLFHNLYKHNQSTNITGAEFLQSENFTLQSDPLQGNYRVELLHREIPIVITGNGTFLQQLECGYEFPALIHVWIASAGVLELFISTSGEATSACKPF